MKEKTLFTSCIKSLDTSGRKQEVTVYCEPMGLVEESYANIRGIMVRVKIIPLASLRLLFFLLLLLLRLFLLLKLKLISITGTDKCNIRINHNKNNLQHHHQQQQLIQQQRETQQQQEQEHNSRNKGKYPEQTKAKIKRMHTKLSETI